jgi:hypothetical protein
LSRKGKKMNNATFSITAVIKNGVRETSGTRWPIWAGMLAFSIIFFIAMITGMHLAGYNPQHEALMAKQTTANIMPLLPFLHRAYFLLSNIIGYIITGPIIAGVIMVAIRKQRGESISAATSFSYYHKFMPLAIFSIILQVLLVIINPAPTNLIGFNLSAGYNALFIPFVFLIGIFVSQTMPLICDKNLNALEAIKTSCSMMLARWNWLKYVALYLIFVVACIIFGIICAILFTLIFLTSAHISEILGVILGLAIGAGIITILILYLPTVINIQANIYKTLTD